MESNEDFKNLIIPKIKEATKTLTSNNHSRVILSDFSLIKFKKTGNYYSFYNKIYANKYLEYFNDEENTDFLIFENNEVYIDYNENLFTFHKVDEQEKILEIDLDNQEIKDPNKINEEELENEIYSKTDLITLCYFPLCLSHCNITLCYEQDLPQVLSSELILQFLNIYQIIKNPSLICGYDSLGGGCEINHLHFEFLMLDDFNNEISNLPIENFDNKLLFETQLKHKNQDEISMFDGTTLTKVYLMNFPFFSWQIECILGQEKAEMEISTIDNLYQNSIAHITNLILSKLIDKGIAHNLILTKQGTIFYLVPRKFKKKEHKFNTCWNDLSGLITCKDENDYDNISEEEINKFFKDEVSLDENIFNELNDIIIKLVDSVYEIKRY